LFPEVPLESHEKGLLKPFAIAGSGDGLSAGTGGGDMILEGEMDRVVEDALEKSSGGLSGIEVCVVLLECAVNVCDPAAR
jgi:hypothetical protein